MLNQRQAALTTRARLLHLLYAGSVVLATASFVPAAGAVQAEPEVVPTPTAVDAAPAATVRLFIPLVGDPPPAPTPRPSPAPSGAPNPVPSPRPSGAPNPVPSPRPSGAPNPVPSPRASGAPTPRPSATPRPSPTSGPPPAPLPGDGTVLQGWYFDRPSDGTSTSTVAQRASWISLTRGNSWRNDLRAAGYGGEIIQYFYGTEVQGPGPYKNSSASCNSSLRPANNTVAYNAGDFCTYIHPNESWFLHNGRGERLVLPRGSGSVNYQMNPASSGWRQFVRERVQRDLFGSTALGFDGIFFDNIALRLYKLHNQNTNSDGTVQEFGDDTAYRSAVVGFLAFQRAGMNGRPLSANLIDFYSVPVSEYLRFTDQLDGYMNEAWGTYYVGREWNDQQWNDIMTIAETTLRQGKELIALAQGTKGDNTRQTFALASYLLVSDGKQAYFRYAYLNEPYTNWWQYSNYGVELGAANGARYRSGNLWRRDFACGYVTVDPVAKRGTITQTCP